MTCEIRTDKYDNGLQCGPAKGDSFYAYHGFVMWGAWTLVGLLQLYTNRYWKHFWRWRQTLHSIAGLLSLVLVIIFGLIALSKADWKIAKTKHTIAGFVTLVAAFLLMLGGVFSGWILKVKSNQWDMLGKIKMKAVHKYFGILLLFGS